MKKWLDKFADGGTAKKWLDEDANLSPNEKVLRAHANEPNFGERMSNEAWSTINTIGSFTPAWPLFAANQTGRNIDKGNYKDAAVESAMIAAPYGIGKGIKALTKVFPKDIDLYHGGLEPTDVIKNLDPINTDFISRQSRGKGGYGGLYFYPEELANKAFKYGGGEAHKVSIPGRTKMYEYPTATDRISFSELQELKAKGYNAIKGKDIRRRDEYILLNPDIIKKEKFLDKPIRTFEDGGEVNPISPKDFTLQYINSPKYRERLSNQGYTDVNGTIKTRSSAVSKTPISFMDTDVNGSNYNGKRIVIDRKQAKEIGSTEEDSAVHEYSHPETQPIIQRGFEVPGMQINDRLQLYKKLKPDFKNPKTYTPTAGHDLDPTENKADMNVLRYQLYKKGVDVFNKDIDMNQLQELKKSNDFSTKRLFEHYEDKDLQWLLNNIASTEKKNSNTTILKNGGQLTKTNQITNFTKK